MTSLLQKINELNVRVDNVSNGGGGGTTIDSTTDISCNTLSTVSNVSIGGTVTAPNQPSFNVIPSITSTITGTNGVTHLPYDVIVHDSVNGYNTNTFEYTVQVAGDYFLYYSCGNVSGIEYATSLRKNKILIDRCLVKDATLLRNDFDNLGGKGLVINRCAVNDKIKVTSNGTGRACNLQAPYFGPVHSFGGFLIG